MAGRGYQEVVNFVSSRSAWERDSRRPPIRSACSIRSRASSRVMRSTLLGGLLGTLRYNVNRKSARVRVFEVGRVFVRDASVEDGPLSVTGHQPTRIAGGCVRSGMPTSSGREPSRAVDFFDVKGDLEALLAPRVAAVRTGGASGAASRTFGARADRRAPSAGSGNCIRAVQRFDLPTRRRRVRTRSRGAAGAGAGRARSRAARSVRRDLRWCSSTTPFRPSAMLDRAARGRCLAIVASVELFDVYRARAWKTTKRVLPSGYLMQDTRRTLVDADADQDPWRAAVRSARTVARRASARRGRPT
jgi:phenylalanyl-tRNA synthetase beta chain